MIVVSGSKRSGTSLWMQLLRAGGFPVIGAAFPSNWGETIHEANPHGFYESKLTSGIGYGTNPDPVTGRYLFADETRRHVVKVFAPGVPRSDIAFLTRVLVTVRPWREHTVSLHKIRDLSLSTRELDPSRQGRESLPPALEWWSELYGLIRDAATRLYPVHFQAYRGLVEEPDAVVAQVFEWLGEGDVPAAVAAVDRALYRNREDALAVAAPELPPGCLGIFDELYARLERGQPLDDAFVGELNATHQALLPLYAVAQAEQQAAAFRAYAERLEE